jgi:hypothetical protein
MRDLPPEQVTVSANCYRDHGLIFKRPGRTGRNYTLDANLGAFWYGPVAEGTEAPQDDPVVEPARKPKKK